MRNIILTPGQDRMQSEKKPAGYEHTLPILYADQRSGLQSDMLQTLWYFYCPLIVKENNATPWGGNPGGLNIIRPGGPQLDPFKAPRPA